MSAKKFIDFRLKHLNRNLSISYVGQPFVIKSSSGVFFTDEDGNRLLDCINNVSHIGHCHPEYVRRLQAQLGVLLTNCRFLFPPMLSATEKLLKMFPSSLSRVLFVNSGSEANDLAMQFARIASGKDLIYCHEGGYHGLTQSCMDVSPYKWNANYKPPTNTRVLTSPCTYRGKYHAANNSSDLYAADFQADIAHKGNFAGLITESMLSCAGQIIPRKDYFQKMHQVVKDNKGYYISDEVQTGFWRLGTHPFAFQHFGVAPDIVTIGKAMGNGFPVSAVVCTEEVADKVHEHGIEIFPTYGGNPMACVATEAVIDIIEQEKLAQNSLEVGAYVLSKFREFLRYERVGDVRGQGLFAGIEFVESKETRKPDSRTAKRVQQLCRAAGVLLSVDAVALNVMKFKPPIVFSKENADQMVGVLAKAMEQAHQELRASAS